MTDAQYLLTENNKIVSATFDIKQFIIKNTTQFNIYIKTSGGNPTASNYDYVIQPNSDFTSSLINTRIITFYTDATNFNNPATITIYDYQHSQPNNTPYIANQVIPNLANFPYVAKASARDSFGASFILLPDIVFSNFSSLYIVVNGGGYQFALVDAGKTMGIGQSNNAYNTIKYTPWILSTHVSLQLYMYVPAIFPLPDITVDAFYSNIPITINPISTGLFDSYFGVIETHNVYGGFCRPPAFYYSLYLKAVSALVVNYNFTITVTAYTPDLRHSVVILSATYTGTFTGVGSGWIIPPTQYVTTDYKFITATIAYNNITNPFDLRFDVRNLNE